LDSTELDLQIKEFNDSLKVQERNLKIAEALKTLKATDAYQLVFDQVFIKEQSESLFKQLTDPSVSLADIGSSEDILRKLDTIKLFKSYMSFIESNGAFAKDVIDNKDIILEEMREA
jgi:NADPH:quinone reductase-like Zn-dependent oxidoreductase